VTRLGEISPNQRLFTLSSNEKYYGSSPKFWASYFLSIDYVLILTKMGWVTFWMIFSQTRLFTLVTKPVQSNASVVKIYSATNSLGHFKNKRYFFLFTQK
jgi:hypothetical protein